MSEKFIVLVGCGTTHLTDHLVLTASATADIYLGPPPMELAVAKREPLIPDFDFRVLEPRRKRARDWEQRNRKQRR